MKHIAFYIIVFALIGFSSSCGKEKTKCPSEFVVYGEVNPYQEVYHIGDTIKLNINSNKMIWDKITEKSYDLSSLKIECAFMIYNLSKEQGNNTISNVTDLAKVLCDSLYQPVLHTFSDNSQIYFSNLLFYNDSLINTISFIPIDTGIYMLSYGAFLIEDHQNFPQKCKNSATTLFTRLNKGRDNNIRLIKNAPNQPFATQIISPESKFYETKSGFAYRVIE